MNSPGGQLTPALAIGDAIARKHYWTYVGPNEVCASACGFMWLAGTPRIKDASAAVGFHAAYAEINGQNQETGVGNALVGAYLGRLGLGSDAILFATAAGPTQMDWITPQAGAQYGIPFEVRSDLETFRTVGLATASMPTAQTAIVNPAPVISHPLQLQPQRKPLPKPPEPVVAKAAPQSEIEKRICDMIFGGPCYILPPDNALRSEE